MDLVERRFRIPFKVPFRGLTVREGRLFRGPKGWAECSPFPWYAPHETSSWERAAYEAAYEGWPPPLRTTVPVNVTVPDCDAATAFDIVKSSGCTTAKVKVGSGDDLGRVEAVRDALGSRGRLRIDVNGAWNIESAAELIKTMSRFDLEYVEQPVESLEDMAALRKLIDVPLAVDEPARSIEGAERAGKLEAADVLIVKVQPIGGVRAGLEAVDRAGLPAVVSSAVETSIGLAAGLALAAALPQLPYACGLGTMLLLEGDVTSEPLIPENGVLSVRRPSVDEAALARYEVR